MISKVGGWRGHAALGPDKSRNAHNCFIFFTVTEKKDLYKIYCKEDVQILIYER